MGSIITKICDFFERIWRLIFEGKEKSLLMVGLNWSGKTVILYKLKLGEVVSVIPTIGFNVENFRYKNVSFNLWDVSGNDKIRPLWRHYYLNSDGLIFVIDSSDRQRIGEASRELHQTLSSEELKNKPLLVLANKQDLDGAMSIQEVVKMMNIESIKDRQWFVQGACAITGDGLLEALDWFVMVFKAQRKNWLLEACNRRQQIY